RGNRVGGLLLPGQSRAARAPEEDGRRRLYAARQQVLLRQVQRLVLRRRRARHRRPRVERRRPPHHRRLLRQRVRPGGPVGVGADARNPDRQDLSLRIHDDRRRRRAADLVGGALTMTPYLSLAIWVPIVAGLFVLAVGRDGDRAARLTRWIALVGAVVGFLVTIPLYTRFDTGTSAMQFVEFREWIVRY